MTKIVHYSPFYETAHFQFASKYWNKRKRTTSEYLNWKFRGKQGEKLDAFILATEGETVIGQLGLIPCSIMVGNEKVEAQWACELMVDTNYRGKGIAKKLYEYAYTLKPLTLGSDPSPAASKSMKRAGFIGLKGPVKFMFPLYIGEVTKLKGFNSKLLDLIPNPFLLIVWIWTIIRGKGRFHKLNREEYIEYADFCHSQNKETARVIHDRSFSDWRFKPFKDYYFGIELYRGKSNSRYSLYRGKDLYLITDFLANNNSSLTDILSEVVLEAKRNDVRQIKLMANTKREVLLLSVLGFVRFRTRTEIIFYCADADLREKMADKYFRYTYMDSDENI